MQPKSDTPAQPLLISRDFNAPRDLIFKAYTEADHLAKWWGPKGFTWVSCTLDLRPGGAFHYCMRSPNGGDMWGKFVYREIVAPERLVFTSSFSDPTGASVPNPWSQVWPLEILNTLHFEDLGGGRTRLTAQGAPFQASPEEEAAFAAAHGSIETGFKGTFEQLDTYLAGL